MSPIDLVPEEDRFTEHASGLPTHITRHTHEYEPSTIKREIEVLCGFNPTFYSDDPQDYPCKTPQALQSTATHSPMSAAQPAEPHAASNLSLPELAPSASDDDVPSPPPRSPEERVYELSPRVDASAFAQSYSPKLVSWSRDEDVATSLSGSLGDGDESGYNLGPPAVAKSVRSEPAPPTNEGTTVSSPLTPPEEEEEEGFTTVNRRRHRPGVYPNPWTKNHVSCYQNCQVLFQSAFASSPVMEQDRNQLDNLFQWDEGDQQRRAKTNQIVPAARIAHRSSAWTPESRHALIDPLWRTISHREKAAVWYTRMDPIDSRNRGQAGHKHFPGVLKEAFSILNNGIVYNPESPSTARQGAA
jgi:hypothetical protein